MSTSAQTPGQSALASPVPEALQTADPGLNAPSRSYDSSDTNETPMLLPAALAKSAPTAPISSLANAPVHSNSGTERNSALTAESLSGQSWAILASLDAPHPTSHVASPTKCITAGPVFSAEGGVYGAQTLAPRSSPIGIPAMRVMLASLNLPFDVQITSEAEVVHLGWGGAPKSHGGVVIYNPDRGTWSAVLLVPAQHGWKPAWYLVLGDPQKYAYWSQLAKGADTDLCMLDFGTYSDAAETGQLILSVVRTLGIAPSHQWHATLAAMATQSTSAQPQVRARPVDPLVDLRSTQGVVAPSQAPTLALLLSQARMQSAADILGLDVAVCPCDWPKLMSSLSPNEGKISFFQAPSRRWLAVLYLPPARSGSSDSVIVADSSSQADSPLPALVLPHGGPVRRLCPTHNISIPESAIFVLDLACKL